MLSRQHIVVNRLSDMRYATGSTQTSYNLLNLPSLVDLIGGRKIISDIRSVLLSDWDPIGIGDNPNLSDEYDGYIGSIINILRQKLPIETIVALLEKIEKTEIGIDNVDIKYLYDVAVKLKKIGDIHYHSDFE